MFIYFEPVLYIYVYVDMKHLQSCKYINEDLYMGVKAAREKVQYNHDGDSSSHVYGQQLGNSSQEWHHHQE